MKTHTSLRIGQIMMARIKRLSALEEKSQHMIMIQCLEKGLNYYEKPYIRKAKENRQEASSGDQALGEEPKDQIEQLRSAHVARLERDFRAGLDQIDDEEAKRLKEEIEIAKAPWVNQDD